MNKPENQLDPNIPSSTETQKVPLLVRIYGILCIANGAFSLVSTGFYFVKLLLQLATGSIASNQFVSRLSSNPLLAAILIMLAVMLSVLGALMTVNFGLSLIKSHRRNAARLSYGLIAFTGGQIIVDIMVQGMGPYLLAPAIQLVILVAISATIDPTLRQERELQRRLRDMVDRDAALEGMGGRDITGEGYIKLNFFNLFWVFVITSFLGLVLEEIWHMVIVDPGVYQDRTGVLFGPFSPIYGCGCVLMTIVLNRFYKKNFLIIFAVSALLGGAFEVFAGWFLQTSFGVVSWSYSHITIFGMPDPIVLLTGGRTCTAFSCMWGLGGLVWIKLLLPHVLKIINLIPWKWRYSLTVVCTLLMAVDCFMTLQSLDFWYQRESGLSNDSPIAAFYAERFDDDYMQERFQSMSMEAGSGNRGGTAGAPTES